MNPNSAFKGKRIMVTGAGGYIGGSLVQQFSALDCEIVRLSRTGGLIKPTCRKAHIVDRVGDVGDPAIWRDLLHGVDIVYHLASQTSLAFAEEDPQEDWRCNVLPVLHLIETCKERGKELDVIYTGTATQIGLPTVLPVDETASDEPVTIYDLHKLQAERYLLHYARQDLFRAASLRLCNVYGPGPPSSSADRGILNVMVRKALRGEALTVYGCGSSTRDYVYVEDVVGALVAAGCHMETIKAGRYLIGSGVGRTILEAFKTVAHRVMLLTGKQVAVDHVTAPGGLSPIEQRDFVANIGLFRSRTGWEPKVGLNDGIDSTARWFLECA